MDQPVNAKAPEKKGFDKYEIEDALRTLVKADEIRANKKLMAEVSKLASKQHKTLSGIVGKSEDEPKSFNEQRNKASGV